MADDSSNLNNMKIPTSGRAASVLYGMIRTKKKKKGKGKGKDGKDSEQLKNEDKQKLFHADIRTKEAIAKTALKMEDREHATGEALKLREHATGEALKLDKGKKSNARADTKARQNASDKRGAKKATQKKYEVVKKSEGAQWGSQMSGPSEAPGTPVNTPTTRLMQQERMDVLRNSKYNSEENNG